MARLNRSIVEIIIGRSRPRSAVSGTPIVTTGCISPLAGTVHLSPLPIVAGVSVEMDAEDSTSTLSKSKAESPETSSGSASATAALGKQASEPAHNLPPNGQHLPNRLTKRRWVHNERRRNMRNLSASQPDSREFLLKRELLQKSVPGVEPQHGFSVDQRLFILRKFPSQ